MSTDVISDVAVAAPVSFTKEKLGCVDNYIPSSTINTPISSSEMKNMAVDAMSLGEANQVAVVQEQTVVDSKDPVSDGDRKKSNRKAGTTGHTKKQSYQRMIISAIKENGSPKGVTRQFICKFIDSNFPNGVHLPALRMALSQGVKEGWLIQRLQRFSCTIKSLKKTKPIAGAGFNKSKTKTTKSKISKTSPRRAKPISSGTKPRGVKNRKRVPPTSSKSTKETKNKRQKRQRSGLSKSGKEKREEAKAIGAVSVSKKQKKQKPSKSAAPRSATRTVKTKTGARLAKQREKAHLIAQAMEHMRTHRTSLAPVRENTIPPTVITSTENNNSSNNAVSGQ